MNRTFRISFILLALLLLVGCSTSSKLSPSQAWSKIDEGAVLVDVRTPAEYQSGHIEGAINISLDQIKTKPDQLALNHSSELVLYCQSGNRAGQAESILKSHGFKRVYNAGGYSNLKANEPSSRQSSL